MAKIQIKSEKLTPFGGIFSGHTAYCLKSHCGEWDIVGRSRYFCLNLSANSVMRGRVYAIRTLKGFVADLRHAKKIHGSANG